MPVKLTQNEVIKRFKYKHGDRYDYSLVEYLTQADKVKIICATHGVFEQPPNSHVQGHGCPSCGKDARDEKSRSKVTTEMVIKRFKETHGDRYDYSLVEYTGSKDKVKIICPDHGYFMQKSEGHASGHGCPKCASILRGDKNKSTSIEFIEKSRLVHGSKFDYSKVRYNGVRVKVEIICPKHGSFMQTPESHLSGNDCVKCGRDVGASKHSMNVNEFLKKATTLFGESYDYSNVIMKGVKTNVEIKCPKHGSFMQTPDSHLRGDGCPKCSKVKKVSRYELEMINLFKLMGLSVETSVKISDSNLELDIYLPEYNMAFEINGTYWHSDKMGKDRNYHKNKQELAIKAGINLYHIPNTNNPEDERKFRELMVNKVITDRKVVYGRKTIISEIDTPTARLFLDKHHVQGFVKSTLKLGVFYDDKLIGVSLFTKTKDVVELVRYSSDCSIAGGLGKVSKYACKHFDVKSIVSFCDKALFDGAMYLQNGYEKVADLPPDYKYVVNGELKHKFGFRLKHLYRKCEELGIPSSEYEGKTEQYITSELLGLGRYWDCGKLKLEYTPIM